MYGVHAAAVTLGGIDRLSIAKLDAFDDVAEAVGAVQAAVVTLGGIDRLEDHGERWFA